MDWVDDLDLDKVVHYNDSLDDEWSEPASSVVGSIDDDSFLFEL